ncbi:metallophosphoesterase family protein [Nitratireductor aquimarinus]|uniref:metallophosphoesterase family protein n=1 Tax=Nitratireductor TaxID=245876 RepID=UPI0019D37283|nr:MULTISPECIES: metallophosphoesterase [Nitratireductor]MBN7775694.1 metallophosphoesterase family protein [Nitratireductor pacificus]MBN7781841.1 metallophosphoesterase family protein [Nitratireductor pacificus]MBN7790647.1 metallophosphoesterase family protein [Nitratireductor aquimarinus]MBN8243102.1 metallophosphoesterase family protein [Nitratireductor aquimarinus]MBY6098441.1 metallophosphoesterase family protein [Nitratireductor aquimarinus]
MSTRICLVADIHHGKPSLTKRGDTALELMDDFARFTNDARPDLVIDLGDRISDQDRDTDLVLEREVAEAFKAVEAPVCHINGNHDRDHLEVADNEDILGQALGHQTLDIGDWRIALWRADTFIRRGPDVSGFQLGEPDILWLSRTVQNADRPLLVLSHVPVSGHSQIGNYYFESNPGVSTYPQAARARAALAQARVPVVCVAGHVHWNTITRVDGITHLTQQSLTESFTTQGDPAGAMGMLELDGTSVRWRVEGKDPIDHAFTATATRWTPPVPPFHELPDVVARKRGEPA